MSEALRYDYVVDSDADSTAARLIRLVGHDKVVLDVGCAAGALDRVLVANGCRVTGLEIELAAAKIAETVCERVIVGDLDRLDLESELLGEQFDVVLAGDVLEHLKDPGRVLADLRSLLRAGGHLVLSVPNTAHADVRLALLHGELPRSTTGLLDTTHLQFLTRSALLDLLTDSGWSPIHLESVLLGVGDSEVPFLRDELTGKVVADLWADPEALAYQYVVVAVPLTADQLDLPTKLLHEQTMGRPIERPTRAATAPELRDLAEELALLELNHTDTTHRLESEVRRLQARVWEGENKLATATRRRKRNRRNQRRQAAATQSGFEQQLAAMAQERDEALRELAQIHASRLWAAAVLYRRGVHALTSRRAGGPTR